jgi:hypothetical protein
VHTGIGSGSIDGADFSDTQFTITSIGDTDDLIDLPGIYFIQHISSVIELDGVGTFDLISDTRTFVNSSSELVGYSRAGDSELDLFNGPTNSAFATWDTLSAVGLVTGTGGQHANAVELITNGTFETGTFAGWTLTDLAGSNGSWFIDDADGFTPLSGTATVRSKQRPPSDKSMGRI